MKKGLPPPHPRVAQLRQPHCQRVGGTHLVVAIGANQQQRRRLRVGEQVLEELEARQIGPLQIIQEHDERVLGGGEHAEELLEQPLEAIQRVSRGQLRNRWLPAHHALQLGHHVHEDLALLAPRLAQPLPPPGELLLRTLQELLCQAAQGLRQGGVGNIPLELLGLPAQEEPLPPHHRLPQRVHHRRLADSGVAADQDELRLAFLDDPLEAPQQRGDVRVASVEALG